MSNQKQSNKNLNNKLEQLAQTDSGEILRQYISKWKSDVKDVSKDLPIDCENEIAVRKNLVELIERQLENRLTIQDNSEAKQETSYE